MDSHSSTLPGRRQLIGAIIAAAAAPWPAFGSSYPASAVKIVVPFPPGGSVDTITRLLSQPLAAQLGQQVIVDNRGGGNGTIGSKLVAQSTPDGYTLVLTASNQIINPLILRAVPYDAVKDFTPVAYIGYVPQLVVVNPDLPVRTFREFIDLVRKSPDRYSWATAGIGTAGHLAEELINQQAGLKMQVIGYRGGGPALTDVMAGHVAAQVEPVPSAIQHVRSGRLRVLAVTSPKRALALPDVPTVAESGLANFDLPSWYGIWGPAGLPAEIARRVHRDLQEAMKAPEVKARFESMSFEAVGGSPDDLVRLVSRDTTRYREIVKAAGIVVDG